MLIRAAEPADAVGIARVHVAAWQSAYRGLLPDSLLDGLSVQDAETRWRERLTIPWGRFVVAEYDGRVVGFASGGESRNEGSLRGHVGEVYVIYVHPHQWRLGYGTLLMAQVLSLLRTAGFEEVVLWALAGNRRAAAFYRAQGFAPDGIQRVKERADGVKMRLVRYYRLL